MHIIGSADIRYKTVENFDFENRVRDRTNSRSPTDVSSQEGDSDLSYTELRLGVELRYQKNLTLYLLFEHQQVFDGNLIDDRSNSTNPGGTDVFGRGPSTENPGFHTERYWIDYKFPGTPLRMRVGADLWNVDQVALVDDDDPRFALFGEFGDFDVMGAAVIQFESQRLGLENDNDLIYYTFSSGYNLRQHCFQFDVVYMRDRFLGADLASPRSLAGVGFQGQKTDAVMLSGSWSGQVGLVRALLQGNLVVGTAPGGTAGLPAPTVTPGRDYNILAGAVAAYAEADLGIVQPFVGVLFGTADGDPTDNKLHGFSPASWLDVTQITGVSWFAYLETSTNFADRDYSCPARSQGLPGPGPTRAPLNLGSVVLGGGGTFECSHTVFTPFNQRIGIGSHLGIITAYSNPGTLLIPVGLKAYPVKGHELVGWYVYRGMVNTTLLEVAFAPELAGKGIGKAQIHEFGGYYQWYLNPYFDIRLAGSFALLGSGFKDIARLADCNLQTAGIQACDGNNAALKGEVRFRARF
jgi:hypothetical protein